jgi:hypothetical protein
MRPSAAVPPHENAILVELRARFSVAFDPDRPLPLALCVHHQLCAAPGVPRSQVDVVLQWRCAMPGYIAALAPMACDGSETGEISDEHRVHAGKQMEQGRDEASGRARLRSPACSQGIRPSSGGLPATRRIRSPAPSVTD